MLSRGEYGAAGGGQTYVRITTPNNLELALEGLVRKVLQEQPKQEDIYSFAADYFETLLDIRDKAERPHLKPQDICPNRSEFEAQSLIKLATSFPKPAFLAAASSVLATEELCRVVDIDEIRAREENTDIEATNVDIDETKTIEENTEIEENVGTKGSDENSEIEANEITEENGEAKASEENSEIKANNVTKENEGNVEGGTDDEAVEAAEVENGAEAEKSGVLNDDTNIVNLADELEDKLVMDDNEGESKLEQEDLNHEGGGENGSEIVNVVHEPPTENDEVFTEEDSAKEGGNKTDEQVELVEVEAAKEKEDSKEGKPSDIVTENSVINEIETDLSKDEQVLPSGEDKGPESEGTLDNEETEKLPKASNDDLLEPMTLEKVETPSETLIKSESTETTETIPAEDAERDIIKEFIDNEKDYCTQGNSTRSVEIAEIHEVHVEEGIPMKEDIIEEATAKELLVENSELVGDVSSNGSTSKISKGAAIATAGGIIGGITYAASDNTEEKLEILPAEGQAESSSSVTDDEKSEKTEDGEKTRKKRDTEDQKAAAIANAGGIIGGITYTASDNNEDKEEMIESEGQEPLLNSDHEKSGKPENGDTEDQGNAEVQNGTADSEIIVADTKSEEVEENDQVSNLEDISTTQEGERIELTDPKFEPVEIKSNFEEVSSEAQEKTEELLQKSETVPDFSSTIAPDHSEKSTVAEINNGIDDNDGVISITEIKKDVEEKPEGDGENMVDDKGSESEENKVEKVENFEESNEQEVKTSKPEKLDLNSLMGEEVNDDNDSREPSLETIVEEKGATPECTPEPKINEETSDMAEPKTNEQNYDNELDKKDIKEDQNSGSHDEVQNGSELTTSPDTERSPSEEIVPVSSRAADDPETPPNDEINKEAEAVVADVIEKATENAIKVGSTSKNSEENNTEEPSSEAIIEVKDVKTELESLPKEIDETANETLRRNDNESENSRSRSSKDSESLGDENPFISAEVKTLVEDEGSVEEPEGEGDEEDKIVPLNAEINPIEEQDEGQWAAQMGLVTAALTIQKTFRNYLQRKRNKSKIEGPTETVAESAVQETTIESQSSALNESMSTDSSLSSSATKIQQSDHKNCKLTRRYSAVVNATTHSFPEEDVKDRTKSFSISHRVRDSEVWSTLEHELESAATTIQNSYKNYKNRQRLRREDAVQITTTGSEDSEGSPKREGLQGTGELHDVIVPEEFEANLK